MQEHIQLKLVYPKENLVKIKALNIITCTPQHLSPLVELAGQGWWPLQTHI